MFIGLAVSCQPLLRGRASASAGRERHVLAYASCPSLPLGALRTKPGEVGAVAGMYLSGMEHLCGSFMRLRETSVSLDFARVDGCSRCDGGIANAGYQPHGHRRRSTALRSRRRSFARGTRQ